MADVFKSFVPEMLVEIVNSNVSIGKEFMEPLSLFLNGICLVVDISGFTRLSGDFCKMGKNGIDQLQLATNGYMGILVEIILSFGGEIIKFAGDAIICIFPCRATLRASFHRIHTVGGSISGDSEGSSKSRNSAVKTPQLETTPMIIETITTALQCAERLKSVQTDKLTVHVAVGCGEICFGVIGGYDHRWECLVSGSCIQDLAVCLDEAPSKHIVISSSCLRVIGASGCIRQQLKAYSVAATAATAAAAADAGADGEVQFSCTTQGISHTVSGKVLPSGNFLVHTLLCSDPTPSPPRLLPVVQQASEREWDPIAQAIIRNFVPVPIADKIDHEAGLSYLAEIREVATMFMKWDSYDSKGKHRDLLKLQHQFYEAQKVLQSTGAYLRQFLVDDKGCVLIACWGMPTLSYLDNSYRALSSAAQIRVKLMSMGMMCSFGITTGDVYCGTVGSPKRMEYAAIGSVVNMAARLMCKANGGILIDESTYEKLPHGISAVLTALEPIKVKGRVEPLPVFSYIAAGSIYVQEKVVDDDAIPLKKRLVVYDMLDRMEDRDDVDMVAQQQQQQQPPTLSIKPTPSGTISWHLPMWSAGCGSTNDVSDKGTHIGAYTTSATPIPIILIKGLEGSGKTSMSKWIRRQAQDRAIPVHCVLITPRHSQRSYFIWRHLFQAMLPKELFIDADAERSYMINMLRQIYPGISRSMRKIKFSALRVALGVTSKFTQGEASLRAKHSKVWGNMDVVLTESEKKVNDCVVRDVVHDVFQFLLNDTTSLLIIENIENADESSLDILCRLLKLRTYSAIVLTALKEVGSIQSPGSLSLSRFRSRVVRQDHLHSTPWTVKYKCIIQCARSTRTIFLEPFTVTQVERMISVALGLPTAPPGVASLVIDYSGGSCFWVLEIMQFLVEHGTGMFLQEIGEVSEIVRVESKLTDTPAARRSFANENTPPSVVLRRNSFGLTVISPTSGNATHSPLRKLVLCRFGNLSLDAQRILRTASIAGVNFSDELLDHILPALLKVNLREKLQALIDSKWICPDDAHNAVSSLSFRFAHVHSHQLIYELTPSSERATTHRQIAEYIEEKENHQNDPNHFSALCYHYLQCDGTKALLYAEKTVDNLLLQVKNIFEFVDLLELLESLVPCCDSSEKKSTLLALINRTRIAIVMFSMNEHVPAVGTPKKRGSGWGLSFLFRGKSSASIAATDDDEHNHHHHDHSHEHEHKHEEEEGGEEEGGEEEGGAEGGGEVCDPANPGLCPCKREEVEDAVTDASCELEPELRALSKKERTKQAWLRQLQEIANLLEPKETQERHHSNYAALVTETRS